MEILVSEQDQKGKGYWKLNNSILDEADFIQEMLQSKTIWINETAEIADPRIRWEKIKYKIKLFCIKYCSNKKRKMLCTEVELGDRLKELYRLIDGETNVDKINYYKKQILKIEIEVEEIDKIKTQGLTTRSQVRWHEKGEKSTKYFFSLGKQNNNGRSIRKLEREDGTCATNYKEILTICKKFYQNLYATKITKNEEEIKQFLGNISVPQLEANDIYLLEQPITSEKCLKTIKTFTSGKSPGNDGISIGFIKHSGLTLVNMY